MTIERKNYVATPADVEKLAASIIDGETAITSGRGTYLRALVATTQAELGSAPRQRSVKAAPLDEAAVAEHIKALQSVYERFHTAVVRVAENTLPDPDAEILRSRTRFSVSAASTVRGYIRAGNDIRALAAARVTKSMLATPVRRRKLTVDAMRGRVAKLGEQLESLARNLNAANREIAHATLSPLIARIAVAAGAGKPTREAAEAEEQNRPWQTKTQVFVPINLAEARAARRALQ